MGLLCEGLILLNFTSLYLLLYICNKTFDISKFLSLIVADKESSIAQESYEETPYDQVAVDTVAVEPAYYEGVEAPEAK